MATYDSLNTNEQNVLLANYHGKDIFNDESRTSLAVDTILWKIGDGDMTGFPPDTIQRKTIEDIFKALDEGEQASKILDYVGK